MARSPSQRLGVCMCIDVIDYKHVASIIYMVQCIETDVTNIAVSYCTILDVAF